MEYNIPTIFNNNFLITQFFGQNLVDYKRFGMKGHNGLDLIPTNGESWGINTVSDGVVIQTGNDIGGFGNFIQIKDGNKVWLYAHLANFSVGKHQFVKKGQLIGMMGNTGNSIGAHLHLGLKIVDSQGNTLNNQNGYFGAVDPLPYLLETPVAPPKPPIPPKPPSISVIPDNTTWKGIGYYEDLVKTQNVIQAVGDLVGRDKERDALKAERDALKDALQKEIDKITQKHNEAIAESELVVKLQNELLTKEGEKNKLAKELKTIREQPLQTIPVVEVPKVETPVVEIPKVEAQTVIVQNAEVKQDSTSKPFWQSKKFWSLLVSAGIGILGSYLRPENTQLILQTVAQVEMTYLGTQTLIDTNIVDIFKTNKQK